jgi:hypothetical protein
VGLEEMSSSENNENDEIIITIKLTDEQTFLTTQALEHQKNKYVKLIYELGNKGNGQGQLGAIELWKKYSNLFECFKDELECELDKENQKDHQENGLQLWRQI